jgi:hypothetical protein
VALIFRHLPGTRPWLPHRHLPDYLSMVARSFPLFS